MDEQELEQVVDALQRYFDHARPNDDAHNAAISRAARERYGGQMLLLGPAVIVDGLRNVVMMQTMAFRDDETADRELAMIGLHLLFCYRSLVKAYGADGVVSLTMVGFLPSIDEDMVALLACTLGLLAEDESPMTKISLQAAVELLSDEVNRRYGTACKVALAWAALRLGNPAPFRTHAIPALELATSESRQSLERLANSSRRQEQRYLDSLVLRAVILDVASGGRALPIWQRKKD
ncbi:MAG: hypothetical protein ACK4VW_00835 [Anaerolineales bacterium]